MTNDRHFRVFESGRVEDLSAPEEFYSWRPDATEEERAAAEREYVETNRRVYAELRERGLLPPTGQNIGAAEINEYLRSGGDVESSE
jgi:hypothetical protein